MLKKFKEFAFRGNIFDLAVGVIIGGAFGKIVTSLVNDIIMPLLGLVTAGINLKELKIVLKPAVISAGVVTEPEVALLIGNFMQALLDLLIIAFTMYVFVTLIGKARERLEKKKQAVQEVCKSQEVELLTQIRDLLKKDNK